MFRNKKFFNLILCGFIFLSATGNPPSQIAEGNFQVLNNNSRNDSETVENWFISGQFQGWNHCLPNYQLTAAGNGVYYIEINEVISGNFLIVQGEEGNPNWNTRIGGVNNMLPNKVYTYVDGSTDYFQIAGDINCFKIEINSKTKTIQIYAPTVISDSPYMAVNPFAAESEVGPEYAIFDIISANDDVINGLKSNGQVVNDWRPNNEENNLWIWEDTFNIGDMTSPGIGYDSFINDSQYISIDVSNVGWSGGAFSVQNIDASHWNDNTRVHVAYRTNGNSPESVGLIIADNYKINSPAKIALGPDFLEKEVYSAILPSVGNSLTTEWQAIDISFAELKKIVPTFNYSPDNNWEGNILSFLGGDKIGANICFDCIYFYTPVKREDLYLCGAINSWNNPSKYKFQYIGNDTYTLILDELYGEFKFNNGKWGEIMLGGLEQQNTALLVRPGTQTIYNSSINNANLAVDHLINCVLTLIYHPNNDTAILTIKGDVVGSRSPKKFPSSLYLVENINESDWSNSKGIRVVGVNGVYTWSNVYLNNNTDDNEDCYFSFSTVFDSQWNGNQWDLLNAGDRYGASSSNLKLMSNSTSGLLHSEGGSYDCNSWILPKGEYNMVVDLNSMLLTVTGTSGIDNINIDSEKTEYYNMQGILVKNPTTGLYIQRKGNKTSKVFIKNF